MLSLFCPFLWVSPAPLPPSPAHTPGKKDDEGSPGAMVTLKQVCHFTSFLHGFV